MASKNSVKTYVENTVYHVYNRGVEKRTIFLDDQDFKVFLNYLKEYLSPPPDRADLIKKSFTLKDQVFKGIERQPNNYYGKVELWAYCLMPNHFHLLIKQNGDKNTIKEFMHSLLLRYSMYFNKSYDRVGSLFQDRYKAIIVMDEAYLLHLSKYIHTNPFEHTNNLVNAYSSYAEYLGIRHTTWVKSEPILSYFSNQKLLPEFEKVNTYKDFVEKYLKERKEILEGIILEQL